MPWLRLSQNIQLGWWGGVSPLSSNALLFSFQNQKRLRWHVGLITPIILWAFVVWASICPCDSQALCVALSLKLHSLIFSSGALNSCCWGNKWEPSNTCIAEVQENAKARLLGGGRRQSCSPRYKMRKTFRKTVHEIAVFSRADDWDVMHIWFVCVSVWGRSLYLQAAGRGSDPLTAGGLLGGLKIALCRGRKKCQFQIDYDVI